MKLCLEDLKLLKCLNLLFLKKIKKIIKKSLFFMPIRDFGRDVSAGTLGFMHGGVKGARNWIIKARKVDKILNPTMTKQKYVHKHKAYRKAGIANFPNKLANFVGRVVRDTKSGFSRSPYPTINSTLKSTRHSSYRSGRTSDRSMTSRLNNIAISRRKKRVKRLHKRIRKTRVSRKLSKKIKVVIDGKMPKGYYQQTFYNSFVPDIDNQQAPQTIQGMKCDGIFGEFFSPTLIADAVSILWNGKAATNSAGQADGKNLNMQSLVVNVEKQWATIKYRNNSPRAITINIYACLRKTNYQGAPEALTDWTNGMAQEQVSGINISTVPLPSGVTTPKTLYATPYMNSAMNKNYAIE